MRRQPSTDHVSPPTSGRDVLDDGLTLIEVVVAMAILSIMSIAVLRLLVGGMDTSEDSRQRVAASQLAAREVEVARDQFFRSTTSMLALAGSGTVTNGTPLAGGGTTLDGTAYSVRRSVQWVPTGNGASACDGGALVNHPSLRVSVAVSWDDMAATAPVTNETLLTPPKNTMPTAAVVYLAVQARNAAGTGQAGVTAVVSRSGTTLSQVTNDDGCAVFQVAAAGDWQVALDTPGFVDQTGAARPTMTVTGALGQLVVASLTYDRPAAVDVTLTSDAGYALPTRYGTSGTLPAVVFERPNVAAALKRTVVANGGATTRVSGLWPTSSGYAFWAGSCSDSDPAAAPTSGSRSPGVTVSAGVTATTAVKLAPVRVNVARAGSPRSGVDVIAYHAGCAGSGDDYLVLGRSDAAGAVKASLPYGQWTVTATGGSSASLTTRPTGVTTAAVTVS